MEKGGRKGKQCRCIQHGDIIVKHNLDLYKIYYNIKSFSPKYGKDVW